MKRPSLDKVLFIVSLPVIALLYGTAAGAFGWFPRSYVAEAWHQARTVVPALAGALQAPPYVGDPVYDRAGTSIHQEELIQPGLTLITSAWKWNDSEWDPGLKLIDENGEVLHSWRIDAESVFPDSSVYATDAPSQKGVMGVHLYPDGDVILNLMYVGTVRLDACGQVEWRLARGGHHSIAKTDSDFFWISAVAEKRLPKGSAYPDGFPGVSRPTYEDLLIKIDGQGNVVEKINVLEVIYANGLQRYIPKISASKPDDITHLNDVEPLSASLAEQYSLFEAGDLLVSLKFQDLVFVVDPSTKEVKWHLSDPFIRQHDPDFMGEGWIGVFDNRWDGTDRGTMLGGSRVLAAHPSSDSLRVIFPTADSDSLYTYVQGQWQQLVNGNLLLTESTASRVVEVAPDGSTVWEWVYPPNADGEVADVATASRHHLSRDEIATWSCNTGPSGALQ